MSSLRVIELFGCLFDKLTVVIEFAEVVGSELVVNLTGRARVDIERDAKTLKTGFDEFVITIDDFLSSDALFAGTNGYGHSVFVATTDKKDITSLETQIAHVDICRDIDSGEVSDMNRTVGIRESRCY